MTNSSREKTTNEQVWYIYKTLKANHSKELPRSYDSWTYSALLDTVCSLTRQNEGRTYNMGFSAMLAEEYVLIVPFAYRL